MSNRLRQLFLWLIIGGGWAAGILASTPVHGQGLDLRDRPVSDVRISGLVQVSEQLVRNQIRIRPGEPYNPRTVEQDIVRITHLGGFNAVNARVEPQADGTVILTYVVEEQALIADVQVVGNKKLTDQELLGMALLRPNDPMDPFLIEKAIQTMKDAYERAGYFLVDINVDQEVREQNILLFKVREGPRVRIKAFRFEGNDAFTVKQIKSQIKSKKQLFLLRAGELNREALAQDAARVRDFYRDRGYLDAQVGRRIDLSPNQTDAVVTFLIDEGVEYRVGNIVFEGNTLFHEEDLRQAMVLKIGDPFSTRKSDASAKEITNLYGHLGFIETRARINHQFYEDQPLVDLLVRLNEGLPYLVGKMSVRGNRLTQDKVILHQIRGMQPGRPFDRAGYEWTERRLRESSLFSDAKVTILGEVGDEYRDVLVEITEAETGSVSFGAGVSSDAGVVGAIELTQRNFNITDYPETFKEFISGKAFRGAGQYFSINLQPGAERSLYSVNFREPYLLESNLFLDTRAFFFDRERSDYDEKRFGTSIGIGQRFGDHWSIAGRMRYEKINIADLAADATMDVIDVQGKSTLSSMGISTTRDTTDSRIFPTSGSRISLDVDRFGALTGDYDFTKIELGYRKYWTVDEDFFGRKTVFSTRISVGYIPESNESPVFERFYAGGHRTFRGFDFRGVGPRGRVPVRGPQSISEDSVGGDWMFLMSFEYNYPIYQELIRGVVFTDTGTIQDDFGMDQYRVAVGAGIRLVLPIFGRAPLALDFAIPILEEEGDQSELISFDFAVPF